MSSSHLHLRRDTKAIQVPLGEPCILPAGTPVHLTQSLGGSYTVQAPGLGGLYRIAGEDADALGLEAPTAADRVAGASAEAISAVRSTASWPAKSSATRSEAVVLEESLWEALRGCYDPEIPVNIVDLGLVYDLRVDPGPRGCKVGVKMTLTAAGCGMGSAIASDARGKLESVPGVAEADVQVVWDPPWNSGMMTETGKRQLGLPV